MPASALGLSSLQYCEPSKLLFYISDFISGNWLQQQKTDYNNEGPSVQLLKTWSHPLPLSKQSFSILTKPFYLVAN